MEGAVMFKKCPSCGFNNFAGDNRCSQCLHTLMSQNILPHKPADSYRDALMSAPVSELLTGKDLLVANTTDTVQKIVEVMQVQKRDCVLIYDQSKLVGIISQRDLLHKVAGKHEDLSKIKVENVMTRNPEFVKPSDPIAYMINKMALGGFRHVPVLADDGTPLSIVSIKDVLRFLQYRKQPA